MSVKEEIIDADVNGDLQMVKKISHNAKTDGIRSYGQPLHVNVVSTFTCKDFN